MAEAKLKSKTAVEEVLHLVGMYDRRGYSTRDIRKELKTRHGIDVSHVTVHTRLKQVRESYKEMRDEDRQAKVAEKLAQYAEVRREAWLAWERSQLPARKSVRELAAPPPPKVEDRPDDPTPRKVGRKAGRFTEPTDPGLMTETLRLLKRIETREGRLPANAYLQTILDTLAAERELLGLDAPTKTDLRAAVLVGDAGPVGFDALADAASADVTADPIGDAIAEASRPAPALPAHAEPVLTPEPR